MITRESITIKIAGDTFSPAEAERQTELCFTDKVEPGEIGSRGHYKGEPMPYGYANLEAPDELPNNEKLAQLIDAILPHIETLKKLGADSIIVYAGYFWKDQCNLTFWPDAMEKLGRLGIPFHVSCYEMPNDNDDH